MFLFINANKNIFFQKGKFFSNKYNEKIPNPKNTPYFSDYNPKNTP